MSKKTSSATESIRYGVYIVEEYKDKSGEDKSHWTRIGVAFPHGDGRGFNLECKAWPVGSQLVVRVIEPQAQA